MEREESKIVKGLCDMYEIHKTTDALNGKEVLEVSRLFEVDRGLYDKEYLGEIDGSFNDRDEILLDEIDARFDKTKVLNS